MTSTSCHVMSRHLCSILTLTMLLLVSPDEEDLSAINEHMASAAMRESASRATSSHIPLSAESSFESIHASARPSTSFNAYSSPSRPASRAPRPETSSLSSRPSSRASLLSLRKMISSDMTSKAPIFQQLQTKADILRENLRVSRAIQLTHSSPRALEPKKHVSFVFSWVRSLDGTKVLSTHHHSLAYSDFAIELVERNSGARIARADAGD